MDRDSNENFLPMSGKTPAPHPYIALSEALSWIAFGDALPPDELRSQVAGVRPPRSDSNEERLRQFFAGADHDEPEVPGIGHFADREQGLERLTQAWRRLRDEVEKGTVRVRGRYSSCYSTREASLAEVQELSGNKLATFSQFDATTGGIQRKPEGSPDVIWDNHPEAFERGYESNGDEPHARDGYLFVEVSRGDLMRVDSAAGSARASPFKAGRPPSKEQILAKADEMKARGLNGRTIAKEMRYEPGFRNVATTQVRDLIKGRWKPGGRPKKNKSAP